jgi:hypothetical protein
MNIEERIREALEGHQAVFQSDGDYGEYHWMECSCSSHMSSNDELYWHGMDERDHAAHQASVVAGIVQPELFEAYELGRDHEFAKSVLKQQIPGNPYRKDGQ